MMCGPGYLQAQELNSIVGNAFKMAYYHQTHGMSGSLGSRQPSFHDVIQQQLLVQKEEYREYARAKEETLAKRLSLISTPKIDERVKELKERRKKEEEEEEKREAELAQGKDRGSWVGYLFLFLCLFSFGTEENQFCMSNISRPNKMQVKRSIGCH